jgi:predicted dehydrogenase
MTQVGIVGLGYWGPNLVRCFDEIDGASVSFVCDLDENRLASVKRRFPHVRTSKNAQELFDSGTVDAVVIATPTRTHLHLAEQSLMRGFHTFVEKPLARSSQECQRLIELARRHDVQLFVGHVFLHAAPVHKLRELVLKGELGELYYIKCNRLNLGPVRNDVNALWDLAPHDISIMLYLLGQLPSAVSCSGLAYLNQNIQDVCNLTLHFPGNRVGIIHVSWLDPRKERVITVVGDRKMAVYDDLAMEKIKVFDKGVDSPKYSDTFGEFQFAYRYGDTYSPRLDDREPLKAECQEFIRCVRENDVPLTDGQNGLDVVRVLEAAEQSLRENGQAVSLVEHSSILTTTQGHASLDVPTVVAAVERSKP